MFMIFIYQEIFTNLLHFFTINRQGLFLRFLPLLLLLIVFSFSTVPFLTVFLKPELFLTVITLLFPASSKITIFITLPFWQPEIHM